MNYQQLFALLVIAQAYSTPTVAPKKKKKAKQKAKKTKI